MIASCPNYLHADVSDGEDLSRHHQEVTGGQLVTMSLVPGTVYSDLVCHPFSVNLVACWNKTRKTILRLLCWEGSKPSGLCASRLNWKKRIKRKGAFVRVASTY